LIFYPSLIPDPEVKKAPDPGSGFATLPYIRESSETGKTKNSYWKKRCYFMLYKLPFLSPPSLSFSACKPLEFSPIMHLLLSQFKYLKKLHFDFIQLSNQIRRTFSCLRQVRIRVCFSCNVTYSDTVQLLSAVEKYTQHLFSESLVTVFWG
jgi:hypothetical protein